MLRSLLWTLLLKWPWRPVCARYGLMCAENSPMEMTSTKRRSRDTVVVNRFCLLLTQLISPNMSPGPSTATRPPSSRRSRSLTRSGLAASAPPSAASTAAAWLPAPLPLPLPPTPLASLRPNSVCVDARPRTMMYIAVPTSPRSVTTLCLATDCPRIVVASERHDARGISLKSGSLCIAYAISRISAVLLKLGGLSTVLIAWGLRCIPCHPPSSQAPSVGDCAGACAALLSLPSRSECLLSPPTRMPSPVPSCDGSGGRGGPPSEEGPPG
mmetsp:Transcript_27990/g.89321  ORF Transcript_27990/g.89321 Transcript_27990/m.89321 type:complete len:270 (-) Transcript_27990:54-863(-)